MTTASIVSDVELLSTIAGDRIRGRRAELRMSQKELGLRVGLSGPAISERETGVKPANLDELPLFGRALGVSVAYLMGFTDDRSRPLEEAASAAVRHVGLEPTTRWLRVTPGVVIDLDVERERRRMRLVTGAASA